METKSSLKRKQRKTLALFLSPLERLLRKWLGKVVSIFSLSPDRATDRSVWQLFADTILRPELETAIFSAARESAKRSGFDVSFDRINDVVRVLARDRAFELIRLDGPESITRTTLNFLNQVKEELADGRLAWSDLQFRLEPEFGAYRARKIAVTETTTLWAGSHLAAAIAAGMTHKRSRRADARRKCPSKTCIDAEEEDWIPITQPFRQSGKQTPAFHPFCYCYLQFRAIR